MKKILIVIFLLISCTLPAAEIRVGIARKDITPPLPFWLSGYSRDKKAFEVVHPLWAKAAVFEESPASRVVIVTTDILGLSHEVSEAVAKQIKMKYGITRSQLLMNSSHTHSGPVIWPNLGLTFSLSPEDQKEVSQYSQKLADDLVGLISMAMSNLAPMKISSGHGSANFSVNRREPTDKGVIIGVNPNGPVDHDVPVIKITTPAGELRAVLFGYACHNTTSATYLINGDYAGFAQIELEKANPGVTAMFLIGCGADQNPYPRGTIEIAGQYGKLLAGSVQKVLNGKLKPVNPPIRTDYKVVDLDFPPFNPELYEREIISSNQSLQKRADLMLEAYNKGWDVSHYPYPVQAVRFNNDLTILALSGEIVVDYSLRAKREYPDENLFVAGYCNEVMCYIPSRRVLDEGGYEADRSMIGYGFPGPFANNVEDRVFSAIHNVMNTTGARSKKGVFKLAAFSSDATPPIGHMLLTGGCKKVESIEGPLEVRGFVLLPPDEKPLVFCSVDWADIRNDAYKRWCDVLSEAAGTEPSRIMLCEVHQHDTPLADLEAQHILERFHSPYRMLDLDWHERVVQSAAAAIRKSLAHSQTITHIGFGKGEVKKIASNRRYILPDGTPAYNRMSSCNDSIAQNAPEGDIDPFLRTLSFWNGDRAICALSIYSTHPMSYYGTGKADPDFPGLARTRRQADDPGIFQIYASGAAGNITAGKYNDGRHENRPVLADRLYKGMTEAWKNTKKQPLTSAAFRADTVRFEPRQNKSFKREDLEKTLSTEGDALKHTAAALGLSWLERVEKEGGTGIIEFPLLDLNNGQVNLLVLPAEIYIEYQLYAQKVNPDSFVMTAGFGESAPGYIPVERAWSECDHNLDDWCWVAPGMEDRIKKALYGLLKQ